MIRRSTWPEDLYEFVDSRRDVPFAWGSNDCSSFAADAVHAITGWRPPLPEYAGAAAAARLLADRSLRDRVTDLFGPEIVPALARRGDLVLMVLDGRETLGVSVDEWIAGPGEHGLIFAPRSIAVAAWAV